ncbi:hypothetical protein EHV15_05505 [Paenibacillus oralis]|uniref:(2Fe-2S)-binding protein n=1 Tax=Paenibacillus oralis TaxID=2490856 RepID=A0A3P3TXA5_9BACL|nr:hypothetical protein [Paenibacillus oralis]RRJ62470.1 hypothetical protein EHV15_05505 [Paenibacillus oralis]
MPIDYELLELQLCIVTKERQDALLTVPAAVLTDRERMESFLKFYQEQIKGLDIQVAATYFASAWRVMCTALQYMLSVTPSRLRFSLENITVQVVVVNQFPWVYFVLNDPEETPWPQGERDAWRENELGGFYLEVLRPVMESIAAVSGVPLTQLWGQIPLGVQYYVRAIAGKLEDEAQRSRLMEDYDYLAKELPASWFGLKRNPFNVKQVLLDDPYRPGEKTPMKPTCCLAYRTDTGHGYCYGCPKLTKQEREAKRLEIMEKMAASKAQ